MRSFQGEAICAAWYQHTSNQVRRSGLRYSERERNRGRRLKKTELRYSSVVLDYHRRAMASTFQCTIRCTFRCRH